MYQVIFKPSADADLRKLRKFEQTRILDAIDDLQRQPMQPSTNRKQMRPDDDLPWEPPVWELRVGEYRVFYDVVSGRRVQILAIRRKVRERTKDIL